MQRFLYAAQPQRCVLEALQQAAAQHLGMYTLVSINMITIVPHSHQQSARHAVDAHYVIHL